MCINQVRLEAHQSFMSHLQWEQPLSHGLVLLATGSFKKRFCFDQLYKKIGTGLYSWASLLRLGGTGLVLESQNTTDHLQPCIYVHCTSIVSGFHCPGYNSWTAKQTEWKTLQQSHYRDRGFMCTLHHGVGMGVGLKPQVSTTNCCPVVIFKHKKAPFMIQSTQGKT